MMRENLSDTDNEPDSTNMLRLGSKSELGALITNGRLVKRRRVLLDLSAECREGNQALVHTVEIEGKW